MISAAPAPRDFGAQLACAVDIEFSLALHAKTGKYFHGRDLIAAAGERVNRQLFWRLAGDRVPSGLAAKVIGRLLAIEVDARVRQPALDRLLPRQRRPRPIAHMDPLTVLLHQPSPRDLILCHDVGPLTHADLFDAQITAAYRKAYAEIAATAPHMVFVSRASQAAFHALFPGNFASSRVIYPPLRTEVVEARQAPPADIRPPFLITVGSVGARKNQRLAIEAFARSGLAEAGVSYVICGGREPGYEAAAVAAQRTRGVRLLGFVADAELNWLYANASGFVLPSLLEGFGVPVAEAISRGLTPLVSERSVLHEVAGEAALLVDPMDAQQVAAGMRQLIQMPAAEAHARREAMAASLARFSPEAFERGWLEAIGEALAGPSGGLLAHGK